MRWNDDMPVEALPVPEAGFVFLDWSLQIVSTNNSDHDARGWKLN
jgi:hypothetical protein